MQYITHGLGDEAEAPAEELREKRVREALEVEWKDKLRNLENKYEAKLHRMHDECSRKLRDRDESWNVKLQSEKDDKLELAEEKDQWKTNLLEMDGAIVEGLNAYEESDFNARNSRNSLSRNNNNTNSVSAAEGTSIIMALFSCPDLRVFVFFFP